MERSHTLLRPCAAPPLGSLGSNARKPSSPHLNPKPNPKPKPPNPNPPPKQQLDVVANDIFAAAVASSGRTSICVSEEEENPIAVDMTSSGKYIAAFDPIDGSSNLDGARGMN